MHKEEEEEEDGGNKKLRTHLQSFCIYLYFLPLTHTLFACPRNANFNSKNRQLIKHKCVDNFQQHKLQLNYTLTFNVLKTSVYAHNTAYMHGS